MIYAVNRNLKKVAFIKVGDTPYVHSIAGVPGLERVTWNTDPEQHIQASPTQPLEAMAQLRPKLRHPLEVFYLD